jgi:hypothetical protein
MLKVYGGLIEVALKLVTTRGLEPEGKNGTSSPIEWLMTGPLEPRSCDEIGDPTLI